MHILYTQMNPASQTDLHKRACDIGYAILALVTLAHPPPGPAEPLPQIADEPALPAKRGRGRPPGTRNAATPAARRPPGRPRQYTPEERRAKFNDYKKQWYQANAETIRAKAREARLLKSKKVNVPSVCDACSGSGISYWSDDVYGPCVSCRCPGCGAKTRKDCKC